MFRRIGFIVFFILTPLTTALATPLCESVRGDINLDGVANLLDIQCHALLTATTIAGHEVAAPQCGHTGQSEVDQNCDGHLNVLDVLLTVQAALQQPWGSHVDGDSDGCADACESILFECEEGWINPECDLGVGHCSENSGCTEEETCVNVDGGHICTF